MSNNNIVSMIDRFIDESDISINYANVIGEEIDEAFPADDYLQQSVEMLAMYRPEGGEFLFNIDEIKKRLIKTREYIVNIK